MFLIDTNVISEARKRSKANPGVRAFFAEATAQRHALYLACVSVGELRRGAEVMRYRGDTAQALALDTWLSQVVANFGEQILAFDVDAAQVWGRLRVPHPELEIDKQIAATALIHGLTVVTRNTADFAGTGVEMLNPFHES